MFPIFFFGPSISFCNNNKYSFSTKTMPIGNSPTLHDQPNNVSLTYLIINANIHFTESQIYKILNFASDNPLHNIVYNQLIKIIHTAAEDLFYSTQLDDLKLYPLTNIQYLSFMIADMYSEIFYIPVWIIDELENEQAESVLIRKTTNETISWILKRCRYNEMWIITYLFKQEFIKIVHHYPHHQ